MKVYCSACHRYHEGTISPTPEELRQSVERGFRKHVLPTWREWDKQLIVHGPRYTEQLR